MTRGAVLHTTFPDARQVDCGRLLPIQDQAKGPVARGELGGPLF